MSPLSPKSVSAWEVRKLVFARAVPLLVEVDYRLLAKTKTRITAEAEAATEAENKNLEPLYIMIPRFYLALSEKKCVELK